MNLIEAILDNLSENGDVLSPFHSKFGNGQASTHICLLHQSHEVSFD